MSSVENISAVADFLNGLDVSIFRALNNFCGWSPALDRVIVHLEVLKGSLFMGIVGVLWFWPDKEMPRRRETLLITILTVALSLVVNRTTSTLLPYRDRPMYSIGANAPTFEWHADLEHWSSFPSDNATYLFAIAAGLWLISRGWGLFFGIFAAFAGLARVFLGIHYPSDIVVGALIGIVTSVAVNREAVRKRLAAPVLAWEASHPPYFYGLFFLALAEMSAGVPKHKAHRRSHRPSLHWIPPLADEKFRFRNLNREFEQRRKIYPAIDRALKVKVIAPRQPS